MFIDPENFHPTDPYFFLSSLELLGKRIFIGGHSIVDKFRANQGGLPLSNKEIVHYIGSLPEINPNPIHILKGTDRSFQPQTLLEDMQEESYPEDYSEEDQYPEAWLHSFEISKNIRVLKVCSDDFNIYAEDCSFLVGPNSFRVLGSLDYQGVPRTLTKGEKAVVKDMGLNVSTNKKIIKKIISGPRFNTSGRDFEDSRISVKQDFDGNWKTVKGNFVLSTGDYPQVVVIAVQDGKEKRPLTREEISEAKSMGFSSFLVEISPGTRGSRELRVSQLSPEKSLKFRKRFPDCQGKDLYREDNRSFVLTIGESFLQVFGSYVPGGHPEDLTKKQKTRARLLGLLVKEEESPDLQLVPMEGRNMLFRELSHNFILTYGEGELKVLGVQVPGEAMRALSEKEKCQLQSLGLQLA